MIARSCRSWLLPILITFWSKLVSSFSLLARDEPSGRFTYVHHTHFLALTRFGATRRTLLSRDFGSRVRGRFGTLSGSLFIQTHRFT